MAPWRQYSNDLIPFPTPNRSRDVYYPNTYHDRRTYSSYPYESRRRRSYDNDRRRPGERNVSTLRDRSLKRNGDLGWSLEYATAWCYKYLNGNQTAVADAIDRVRELPEVDAQTPFIIFDFLDKALFGGRLRGMVYMRWKTMISSSPGTTSAPGVVPDVPRICIELNKTPFEDDDGDIDDLLDALLHQMIHAFFLVACGAQPKGAKQDGRLMDGLHFGVIMYTIQDITRRCQDGELDLIFYAAERAAYCPSRNDSRRYIAMDPRGSAVGPAPADGQSHCCHDNRKIRPAQIKNWQVEGYSLAIDLDMESKGDVIFDLGADSKLVEIDRLKGPPSSSYVELIWDKKRVMVPREKAVQHKSIKKPLEKNGKMELQVPDCSFAIFCQVYNFFTKGSTGSEQDRFRLETGDRTMSRQGPPIILGHVTPEPAPAGLIVHLQLFKVAEGLQFEELDRHVIEKLWKMPTTADDPIEALKELYNDKENSGPIHSELHKWARAFLGRTDDDLGDRRLDHGWQSGNQDMYRGISNYEKLLSLHGDRFTELYFRNTALKEDVNIVYAQMHMNSGMGQSDPLAWSSRSSIEAAPDLATLTEGAYTEVTRPLLPRSRSWYNPLGLTSSAQLSPYSSSSWSSSRSALDDMALLQPALRPRKLDWLGGTTTPLALPSSGRSYRYYGRDGRLKTRDRLTGDTFVRRPYHTYDEGVYSF